MSFFCFLQHTSFAYAIYPVARQRWIWHSAFGLCLVSCHAESVCVKIMIFIIQWQWFLCFVYSFRVILLFFFFSLEFSFSVKSFIQSISQQGVIQMKWFPYTIQNNSIVEINWTQIWNESINNHHLNGLFKRKNWFQCIIRALLRLLGRITSFAGYFYRCFHKYWQSIIRQSFD